MRIAIVGAGWYGCHLALSLTERGHNVDVYERGNDIFYGSSGKNQNRLHSGFHYPRSYATRAQTKSGYDYFCEHYPDFVHKIENNYYAVSKNDSLIDFETYKTVMNSSGAEYEETNCEFLNQDLIEGTIRVDETLVLTKQAKKYFASKLQNVFFCTTVSKKDLLTRTINGKKYEWVINSTWNGINTGIFDDLDLYYEPCVMFCYKNLSQKEFAITVVDGDLFSIYPYFDDVYTLSSVEHIAIKRTKSYRAALDVLMAIDVKYIDEQRDAAEQKVREYFPNFDAVFRYMNPDFSIKTKMKSSSCSRECIVRNQGNLIDIFSGKISTVGYAEKRVLEIIG